MATPDDFKVSDVYKYKNPEDLKRYYDDWAHAYNGYCETVQYTLPQAVSKAFASKFKHDFGWIIDIGCGTGLVGKHLRTLIPYVDIHGIDLSPEMVKIAMSTNSYQWCSVMNIKDRSQITSGRLYDGMISAGTFTLGHLDPSDLEATFRLLKPGALVSLSIKKDHYFNELFEENFIKWSQIKLINNLEVTETNGYNSDYEAANQIATFFINK